MVYERKLDYWQVVFLVWTITQLKNLQNYSRETVSISIPEVSDKSDKSKRQYQLKKQDSLLTVRYRKRTVDKNISTPNLLHKEIKESSMIFIS